MVIYPAIDLYDGKAVRLFKGDYGQMTVYSEDPASVARDFKACGADHIHLVDLAGAKSGKPENLATIAAIIDAFGGFVEVGGGIRDMDTVKKYIDIGVNRVILGTAAVKDPDFLQKVSSEYADFLAAYSEDRDLMRFHYHKVPVIGKELADLSLSRREYQSDMAEVPDLGRFITEDYAESFTVFIGNIGFK